MRVEPQPGTLASADLNSAQFGRVVVHGGPRDAKPCRECLGVHKLPRITTRVEQLHNTERDGVHERQIAQ
ncbi:MAG: hypothetical protein M3071_07330 [Actinomycetota bacterium]|nr:hypothetical protein [Actinomycetota bacterium]